LVINEDVAVDLKKENIDLLSELETAYQNMEIILEQSNREKEIVYHELQQKFDSLKMLYDELSDKENMLIHLEKLSSIGQFISELVHELSNPLTAISGHADILMIKNPPEEIYESIHQISENAKRMSGLLSRFRAMAYKSKEDFHLFDMNQNLKECLMTIDVIKPRNMEIEINLCQKPLLVKGDPYQANQIFLNLAKNAFDAMLGKDGRLKISSNNVSKEWIRSNEEIGENYCQAKKEWNKILEISSRFAFIEFEDQGAGIPKELMSDIFNAFFTTKERGKGTGLGLSICSDIIKRHNGNLIVKSELGFGTTFQILIPLSQ